MKKISAVLLAIVLCLSLSSCLSVFVKNIDPTDTTTENVEITIKNRPNITFDTTGKTCYYYNSLNELQKESYALIYNSVMNFEESCIVDLNQKESEKVWTAVFFDNPELIWTQLGYEYKVMSGKTKIFFTYLLTQKEAETLTKQVNKKIDSLVEEASQFKTDFEKELFFHDYICENVVYDIDTLETYGHTTYGLLLNGRGICEGYARCMQVLLEKSGIPNYLVVGKGISDGESESHMWNVVEIDGENYHLDATWDDLDNEDVLSHVYFNLRDQDILIDHQELVPENNNCNSLNANYFCVKNTYITHFESFDRLVEPCAEALKNGQYYIEFKFENKNDYYKALYTLENNYSIFTFIDKVSRRAGNKIVNDNFYYINYDEQYCLRIIFLKK